MLFCFSAVLRAQKLEFLSVLRYKIVWVKRSTLQLYYLAIFTLPWYIRLVLSHASRVLQTSYVGTRPVVGWLAGVQICTCDMQGKHLYIA